MTRRSVSLLVAASAALTVLVTTQLGEGAVRAIEKAVPLATFAKNSGKLQGHTSSRSPHAGQIPIVGSNGKLSASILPTSSGGGSTGAAGSNGSNGTNGANGATGPTGPTGPTGLAGAPGAAGPSNAYAVFSNGPTTFGSAGTTVTLSIPSAGSYVIFGKAYISSNIPGDRDIACSLHAGGDFDDTVVAVSADVNYVSVALNVVHTYSGADTAYLRCGDLTVIAPPSGHLMLNFVKITAIKVGTLANTGA
jgi:hypothetical protein